MFCPNKTQDGHGFLLIPESRYAIANSHNISSEELQYVILWIKNVTLGCETLNYILYVYEMISCCVGQFITWIIKLYVCYTTFYCIFEILL